MYISDFLGINFKGHHYFDFVDANLDDDNRLFIDPCLIECSDDPWCANANRIMHTFFDGLFYYLRHHDSSPTNLFSHAGEQNATKLGYGNGQNGKGKTATGLWDSLKGLSVLAKEIPTINQPQDIPVLVEGFAEDCMSDLLTNILHGPLNEFTSEQMRKWECPPQGEHTFWTFDSLAECWVKVTKPSWFYNGREILLVPKWIVRKNYLFKAHQYLYSVISDRVREQNGWDDLKKIDIWRGFPRNSAHWEYDNAIEYTKNDPDALEDYHYRIPSFYNRAGGHMSDKDLDNAVYRSSLSSVG